MFTPMSQNEYADLLVACIIIITVNLQMCRKVIHSKTERRVESGLRSLDHLVLPVPIACPS